MSVYGEFDLNGWHFKAEMPDSVRDDAQWTITFIDPEGIERVRRVPMWHESMFGPDVEDVAALNAEIEAIITDYGIE